MLQCSICALFFLLLGLLFPHLLTTLFIYFYLISFVSVFYSRAFLYWPFVDKCIRSYLFHFIYCWNHSLSWPARVFVSLRPSWSCSQCRRCCHYVDHSSNHQCVLFWLIVSPTLVSCEPRVSSSFLCFLLAFLVSYRVDGTILSPSPPPIFK